MCDSEDSSQEQRLLRNMGAYKVVLDLLEVPYDSVCSSSDYLKCTLVMIYTFFL